MAPTIPPDTTANPPHHEGLPEVRALPVTVTCIKTRAGAPPVQASIDPPDRLHDGLHPPPQSGRSSHRRTNHHHHKQPPTLRTTRASPRSGHSASPSYVPKPGPGLRPFRPQSIPRINCETACTLPHSPGASRTAAPTTTLRHNRQPSAPRGPPRGPGTPRHRHMYHNPGRGSARLGVKPPRIACTTAFIPQPCEMPTPSPHATKRHVTTTKARHEAP